MNTQPTAETARCCEDIIGPLESKIRQLNGELTICKIVINKLESQIDHETDDDIHELRRQLKNTPPTLPEVLREPISTSDFGIHRLVTLNGSSIRFQPEMTRLEAIEALRVIIHNDWLSCTRPVTGM